MTHFLPSTWSVAKKIIQYAVGNNLSFTVEGPCGYLFAAATYLLLLLLLLAASCFTHLASILRIAHMEMLETRVYSLTLYRKA